MLATLPLLQPSDFPMIQRDHVETLQVNLGYLCNQQCQHCHVNAGPKRTEKMDAETAQVIMNFLRQNNNIRCLDLTGGAPELNVHFRPLVKFGRALSLRIIDRCNLTVLSEADQLSLADFLAEYGVEIVASLPCYIEENVDKQRGDGVFSRSISGLRRLNALGYGQADTGLILNLVFNPLTATLPPAQAQLEADYRLFLQEKYGIVFNQLFTLCNMPIQRFGSWLISTRQFNNYLELLRNNFCSDNLDKVMCRHLLSVDWRGYVYDCDFNQMLQLPVLSSDNKPLHLSEWTEKINHHQTIRVAEHCYACTAGQGSSCGGAL
jgi:radical SAM/Cys-rich protein